MFNRPKTLTTILKTFDTAITDLDEFISVENEQFFTNADAIRDLETKNDEHRHNAFKAARVRDNIKTLIN